MAGIQNLLITAVTLGVCWSENDLSHTSRQFADNTGGIIGNPRLQSITIYEATDGVRPFTFAKDDPRLVSEIDDFPNATQCDFHGTANEYYDVFISNSDGTPNSAGACLTIICYFDQLTEGVGNNIDAVSLDFTGSVTEFAQSVTSFVLGASGQHSPPPDGNVNAALGPPDTHCTFMGYHYSRLTLRFGTDHPYVETLIPTDSFVGQEL